MKLPSLTQISTQLEQRLTRLAADLPEGVDRSYLDGPLLRGPGMNNAQVAEIERYLGRRAAPVFRYIVTHYDLAGVELAGMGFGGAGPFSEFLIEQARSPGTFWGDWQPLPGQVAVASSAGWVLLVATDSDFVSAWERDTRATPIVARNMEFLLRGLGWLALGESLKDPLRTARELSVAVKGDNGSIAFWRNVTTGHA